MHMPLCSAHVAEAGPHMRTKGTRGIGLRTWTKACTCGVYMPLRRHLSKGLTGVCTLSCVYAYPVIQMIQWNKKKQHDLLFTTRFLPCLLKGLRDESRGGMAWGWGSDNQKTEKAFRSTPLYNLSQPNKQTPSVERPHEDTHRLHN